MSIQQIKEFLKQNYLFTILAILSFIVHFAFLSYPSQTVFDEVHFGKFVSAYFTHEYYFDIHPPLGKLLIAAWAKLMSFTPDFDFDHIGEAAAPQLFFTLRFLPALFGSLFVMLFAWFAFLATKSRQIALIAGTIVLLDNAFLVQSKIIAIDIFLFFFEILTLCFFLLYQKEKSFSKRWFVFLALAGISFGLTVSVKWTGLAAIGIIFILLAAKILSQKTSDWLSPDGYPLPDLPHGYEKKSIIKNHNKAATMLKIKEAIAAAIVIPVLAFSVYLIPFYIHFSLLYKSGPGNAFMSASFQNELKEGRKNIENPLSFWEKFKELNITMYTANSGLTATHPFGSTWTQWPFDKKPIYYWYQAPTEENGGKIGKIYFLGNPAIWYLAFGAIIFTLLSMVSKKERRNITPLTGILIIAYFANLLPFIGIKRVAFLYHYLPSIVYAILLLSIYLEKIRQNDKEIFTTLMIIIIICFAAITPLSYGWLMSPSLDVFETKIINIFN